MPRRSKYLVISVFLLAVTLWICIVAGAAVRYNRTAGTFDSHAEGRAR